MFGVVDAAAGGVDRHDETVEGIDERAATRLLVSNRLGVQTEKGVTLKEKFEISVSYLSISKHTFV